MAAWKKKRTQVVGFHAWEASVPGATLVVERSGARGMFSWTVLPDDYYAESVRGRTDDLELAKHAAERAAASMGRSLSGIGGHVAGMFGAMMEPAKVSRVVAEMADLTAHNQHTEARLEWAKAVNSTKWMRILRALQEMTAAYGYLPGGGGEIQIEADRALYRMTEQQFGKAVADQFKAAL